ncbi:FkbM family methyltransferase [Winogradskyella litorisediminis]|uniref:FkbM family methyltransferase n=1 Tax=Winogradskyella litorisediminis TaxID=1156618 RepID=A0ABW3NA14_9FLAO
MNLMNAVVNGFSSLSRSLPKHRKLNQLYKHFNWVFLTLGAKPIVNAKMEDDTTIKVDLSTRTERMAFYTGAYDSDLLEVIKQLLNTDGVFLDVGANIGFYSVAISNVFRVKNAKGKTLAFEPFEGNFKRLTHNIEANNLSDYCILNNFGLSDTSTTTEITLREDFKHGSNTGNASIPTSESMDAGFKTSSIQLKTLDEVWNTNFSDLENIDLIKMDIEGHEDFCFKGGVNSIAAHRPTIMMEVNKPYYEARGVDLDEIFLPLIPENYTIYREVNKTWTPITSLKDCGTVDNVFMVPHEKLNSEAYRIFS